MMANKQASSAVDFISKERPEVTTTVHRIGFWSGVVAFSFTVAFVIVQVLQLLKVTQYPLDEILIYATSLGIVVPFLIEILSLHYATQAEKQIYSHTALIFALLYAVFVTANYVVQLGTVIPMSLRGSTAEIQVLIQTPHSMFWNFDAVGYICMGLANLAALPIFTSSPRYKHVRRAFLANFLVTPFIATVYFSPGFSEQLLLLGLPWAITAPWMMIALAKAFKES